MRKAPDVSCGPNDCPRHGRETNVRRAPRLCNCQCSKIGAPLAFPGPLSGQRRGERAPVRHPVRRGVLPHNPALLPSALCPAQRIDSFLRPPGHPGPHPRLHRPGISRCPGAVRHRRGDHLRAGTRRPVCGLHGELVQLGVARPAACRVEPEPSRDEPRRVRGTPGITRSTCSRWTRPTWRGAFRVRTPIASPASTIGWAPRARR